MTLLGKHCEIVATKNKLVSTLPVLMFKKENKLNRLTLNPLVSVK